MNRSVTYGDLGQLFVGLGFEDRSGEYLIYQHPAVRAAVLRMAFHEPQEAMLERDVVAARAVLDLNALMERDDFDQWVRDQKTHKATIG